MKLLPALVFVFFGLVFTVTPAAAQNLPASPNPVLNPGPSASAKVGWEKITNERKRQTSQWLETKLKNLNQKAVKLLQKHLERLETILKKTESRVKKLETEQPAATKVYPLLENLKLEISNLRAQLQAQAKKEYRLEGWEEHNLKWQALQTQQNLGNDLKFVREKLINQRKNLNEILKILSGL